MMCAYEQPGGIFEEELVRRDGIPSKLPPVTAVAMSDGIVVLLINANAKLAVLENLATRIPNNKIFRLKE